MIIIDCKQHSEEWHQVRLGIPTASMFHLLVKPKDKKPSASRAGYAKTLIAERLLGVALESVSTGFMDRGAELEESAVAYYDLDRGLTTTEVGFVLTDDRLAGCSPDRLVGDTGGLEIKCLSPAVHISNMISVNPFYLLQVQGCMWITQREWWDLLFFHPDIQSFIVHIPRDIDTVVALSEAVDALYATMREAMLSIRKQHGVEEHVWYPPSEFQAPLLLDKCEEPGTVGGEATAPGPVPAWEAYR